MFGNNKNKIALEQIEALKAELGRALEQGLGQIKSDLDDLKNMRSDFVDNAKEITDSLDLLKKDFKESLESIKLDIRFPPPPSSGHSGHLTMGHPLGSREMVEYWGRQMAEARYQRTQAMEAYQESLKGKN